MQSRRGSCSDKLSSSPPVKLRTGGASSLNASGRLLAFSKRSVASSRRWYRLLSVAEVPSPPSFLDKCLLLRLPRTVELRVLSRNGGQRGLPFRGTRSTVTRRSCWFHLWEPISSSPVGEPPQVCDTISREFVSSRK